MHQCVAVDAVVEVDLVSALKVSIFPEMVFTKAGKILYREKGKWQFIFLILRIDIVGYLHLTIMNLHLNISLCHLISTSDG